MDQFAMPAAQAQLSREHSAQDWENHREVFTRLYSKENRPLDEVIAVMRDEYGFNANKRQYNRRISQWHLDKNIKDSELRHIAQKQKKRKVLEGKETRFEVRGQRVNQKKIDRAVNRKNITDEELLAMQAASTPSDIFYETPSAFDPHSPHGKVSALQSPTPILDIDRPVFDQSVWSPPNGMHQTHFLQSPGYIPATPLPQSWYAPVTPFPAASYQTPPNMFQSPGSLWDMTPFRGVLDTNDSTTQPDHDELKFNRLLELVRETEEILGNDYMKTMSDINSLVYDLITSDQSSAISKAGSAPSPKCLVCKVLDTLGTDTMAKKVESERVILEAIAVGEGLLGEDHIAPIHFRVELFILYNDWECREDSVIDLLTRTIVLASQRPPPQARLDPLSELLRFLKSGTRREPCVRLRGIEVDQIWLASLDASTHPTSSPPLENGNTVLQSPRRLWELISFACIASPLEVRRGLAPILQLILQLGSATVDGSLPFWMAVFVCAVSREWGPVFNSRHLISNAFIQSSMPGSATLQSTLERLFENPYRVETSTRTAGNGRANSETRDEVSPTNQRTNVDDFAQLEGSLLNLDELRVALAEAALGEIEKSSDGQAVEWLVQCLSMEDVHRTICMAAELDSSKLIILLGKCFGNSDFETFHSLTDILNHTGEVGDIFFDETVPLCLAAEAGHLSTVEALVKAGADPNGPGGIGETPLQIADRYGHDAIVYAMFKLGARGSYSRTLAKCIIDSSERELQERWIEEVSEENDKDLFVNLLAITCAGKFEEHGYVDVLSQRIKFWLGRIETPGWSSNLRAYNWDVSRVLEAEEENARGLELLLDSVTGVHVEQQARSLLRTVLLVFLEDSENLPEFDKSTCNPVLHTFISRNAPNALRAFLDLDPYITTIDQYGNTALHIAAALNRKDCVGYLLKYEIDVDATNNLGETALQIAVKKKHTKLEALIRRALDNDESHDKMNDN